MTDPALDREAIAVFEQSLEIDEADRAKWIDAQTVDRAPLRDRVMALIDADRLSALQTGGAVAGIADEPPLERVGAYRITGLIGGGGMGTVYRGERASGDFRHVVAVKVIKPGLLSERLVERFETERQTLAQLAHPNIAQLFDGGETERGSPYIVMEFIDGLPILQWANEKTLARAQRLRLFADVCGAVAFAHRSLIVHRDLTPSNVLVTRDGIVKLIDFGIAKPADASAADGAASIGTLSLTPGYAAPERMTSANVTTAADIFSLGRLLEKLMPPGPDDAELTAIIARATAHRPEARYPTAEALGEDLVAWSDGQPVAAVAGGRRYVVAKFVRRHRIEVTAAVVTAVLLVAALLVALTAYTRAERARQAEAARFAELRSLAGYMIFDLDARLSRVVGNADARAALVNRAQAYLSALAASPGADPAVRLEAARGFVALARVQGVPTQPNLGQTEQARSNLISAIRLASTVGSSEAAAVKGSALTHVAMINAHNDLKPEDAAKALDRAGRTLGAVPAARRDMFWLTARSDMRRAQLELAVLQQKPDELVRLADMIEREIGDWPAALRTGRAAALDRAYAAHYRGLNRYFVDQLVAGIAMFQDAGRRFAVLDQAVPNDPLVLSMLAYNAYVGFGAADGVAGRGRDADTFLAQARTTIDRLRAIEPRDRAAAVLAGSIRQAESQSLSTKGRHAEAITVQREVLDLYGEGAKTGKATARGRLALAHKVMGNIATTAGDRVLACAEYRIAIGQFDAMEQRKEMPGFLANHRPGIATRVAQCSSGTPLSPPNAQ